MAISREISINTKQKIEIMQAFEDGVRIEYKDPCTGWREVKRGIHSPSWNWERDEYRIKKAPKYYTTTATKEFLYEGVKVVEIKALQDALEIIDAHIPTYNLFADEAKTLDALEELVK